MDCSIPGFPIFHCLSEWAQTHVLWVDDAIQPSQPLLSLSPFALNLSQHQGLFQWVTLCIRWPRYWCFIISPSSEYSGLISFRIDRFDLLAIQLSSVFSSIIVQKHQFISAQPSFLVQLSYLYMTTGKPTTVTIQTFVSKESIAFYVSTIAIEMWIYVKNSTIWRIILRENI